jgi:arabinose-5-phosphate isomerase
MSTKPDSILPFRKRAGGPSVAARTIAIAVGGLRALEASFTEPEFAGGFDRLVEAVADLRGRVIVAGMGKSGIIARKITATLTSTGTPAMFLHPAEAGHGDLGMVTGDDLVLIITRSGETAEFAPIFRYCKRFGITLVTITARPNSTAARAADFYIKLPSVREACPIELTPTTSTTVQLVFGDALAIALMHRRGFSADDFYKFHPNGRLGARLLKVRDVMARGPDVPKVRADASLLDATVEMTRARLGGTAVVDADGKLIGAFTDGDLRRSITGERNMNDSVREVMTVAPLWIGKDELASEAIRRMHEANVLMLFVQDGERLVGAVHMHDVLRAGVA